MQCDTVEIKGEDGEKLTINKADFNPDIHTLFGVVQCQLAMKKQSVKRKR
tara:strand:+ start:1162 stop:1311 length:150 start_codon:yes stop_codon:yes gene_type:complete